MTATPDGPAFFRYRDDGLWGGQEELLRAATATFEEAAGGRRVDALEVGCGNGAWARRLSDAGHRVWGIELAEQSIEVARAQAPAARFAVGSAYDDLGRLFPEQASWDAVVALEVIEHLYDPRRFVRAALGALRPGGFVLLSTPYHGYAKNLLLALTGRLDAHFTALWDGGHIKFWSRRTLTALLAEQGLAVTRFRGVGRGPGLWRSMILVARRQS